MKKFRLYIALALVAVLTSVTFNSCGFGTTNDDGDTYYKCIFYRYKTDGLTNMAAIHQVYDAAFAQKGIAIKMSEYYLSKGGTIDGKLKEACALAEENIQKQGLSYGSEEYYTVTVVRFTASHTKDITIYSKDYGNVPAE